MPLQPLQIVKNWFTNTRTREENWDALRQNIVAFATRTNNNLKQLGLDIGGVSYDFNNVGKSTQAISILSRLETLEIANDNVAGFVNLGLNLSDPAKVKIVAADGSDLSADNVGRVSFNSTSNAGQIVSRDITANIEVTLTGAHWGFDTFGDLADYPLWIFLFDTGTGVALGVAAQAGRSFIASGDTKTLPASVNSIEKVLTNTTISSNYNIAYLGWVKANFDDTGNINGENYWAIQTSVGDINFGPVAPLTYGEIVF